MCLACRCICWTWLRCSASTWRVLCSTLPKFWSFVPILWSGSTVSAQARALVVCMSKLLDTHCLHQESVPPPAKSHHNCDSAGPPYASCSVAALLLLFQSNESCQPEYKFDWCRPFFLPCLAVASLSVMATLSSIFLLQETLPRIVAEKQLQGDKGARYHKLKGELRAIQGIFLR